MPLLLVKIHVPMLAHKNEYTVFHLSASILKFLQYFEDFALRQLLPDYAKADDIFYFDYISGKAPSATRTQQFFPDTKVQLYHKVLWLLPCYVK